MKIIERGVGRFLGTACAAVLSLPLAVCLAAESSHTGAAVHADPAPPFPMPELTAPVFPNKTFSIADYGAVPDGKTKNTAAFAKAIAACHQAGGGRVIVPKGNWFTGAILMQSHVDLHLEKGAIVSFSSEPVDYAPSVFASLGRARPGLICNNEGEDLALTGEGEFNGNGQPWWKPVAEKKKLKLKRDPRVSTIPAEFSFIDPGTGRKATIGRPTFVSFNNSTNLLIEGVTFRDGPIFMVHPNDCENVIIRNIRVLAGDGENTDGIDPAACKNVLIENCYLDTGDDCLVIKSSPGRPAENIVIRNLKTKRGHGGVVIGSTVKGGVRNVFAYNCDFDGTDAGIRIKSNRDCGGTVENLWFQDIRMGTILKQAIIMEMWYNDKERTLPPNPRSTPVFRNVHIRDVTCKNADQAMVLIGLPESPIHDITLENVTIHARKGVTEEHTKNIVRSNVKIETPQ
jgi:polygalacturonase